MKRLICRLRGHDWRWYYDGEDWLGKWRHGMCARCLTPRVWHKPSKAAKNLLVSVVIHRERDDLLGGSRSDG